MATLSRFEEAQQLSMADALAEFGIEVEEATDGDCPYRAQCEERRRLLPHYRESVACHWIAWGDWRRCPIHKMETES